MLSTTCVSVESQEKEIRKLYAYFLEVVSKSHQRGSSRTVRVRFARKKTIHIMVGGIRELDIILQCGFACVLLHMQNATVATDVLCLTDDLLQNVNGRSSSGVDTRLPF